MKRNFILIVLFASGLNLTACGLSGDSVLSVPPRSDSTVAESGQAFELTKDLSIESMEQGTQLLIPAGTGVSILENAKVDNEEMVRLGLDFQEDSKMPQDIWVSAKDFSNAKLNSLINSDPYDEYDNENSFSEFSRKKMTYCYRYVKQYLLSHGMVSVYLPGSSAWMAAGELPKHGFKKSNRKAANAIVNDVCVYRGGPAGHGHIEVLTSKGWYYGYGYKSYPIQNRIFSGCFHK